MLAKLACWKTVAGVLLTACLLYLPQGIQAQTTTYRGEAVVVEARALFVNVAVSDTGSLPSSGGSLSASLLNLDLPGLLDVNLLDANTTGGNERSDSNASVATVAITAAGVSITAAVLTSQASTVCFFDHAEVSGSSQIASLTVNGHRITVTGQPNQTVPLIVGSLVINEQISNVNNTPGSISGDMLVNALHLNVLGAVDVVISSSRAGASCSGIFTE